MIIHGLFNKKIPYKDIQKVLVVKGYIEIITTDKTYNLDFKVENTSELVEELNRQIAA